MFVELNTLKRTTAQGQIGPPQAAVKCPICLTQESDGAFSRRGFEIGSCVSCGHQYLLGEVLPTHVQDCYSDSYFFNGQAGYSDYLSEKRLLIARGRRYAQKIGRFGTARILDIGSAAGYLLRGFIDEGWSGMGVEPNATMARYARAKLGLNVATTTYENFETDERFDLVTMFQVVSHFADPRLAVEKASEMLLPGGLLLIETWDRLSMVARVCGENWHEYNPPTVRHWFSRTGLDGLGRQFGLVNIRSGKMVKWISAGYAKSILRHNLPKDRHRGYVNRFAELMPSSLSIPYPGDDLFWAVFQKDE